MDPFLKTRTEIDTLHELLPELDYYQILGIEPATSQSQIDPAFRRESRRLHPDRFARLNDNRVKEQVNEIYRLVNEAYRTLRDPDARARYDSLVARGEKRMTAAARAGAVQEAATKDNPEHAANTPKGDKYWKMALKAWEDEDFKACVMQIQFALTFEPDNAVFKEWLEKSQKALQESDDDRSHSYKLRIV